MRTQILAGGQCTHQIDETFRPAILHHRDNNFSPVGPDRALGMSESLSEYSGHRGAEEMSARAETSLPADSIGSYECLVEVVIKPLAQPERVLEVLKTLNDSLWADLVYVETTDGGTCIVSRVRESSSFLNSLPKMPSVSSWVLTYM